MCGPQCLLHSSLCEAEKPIFPLLHTSPSPPLITRHVANCKKHPSHKNLNGVCPYCLREKLANISGSSSSSTNNAGSSSSSAASTPYSSYDSEVSSSVASPPQREERNKKRFFQLLKGRRRRLKSSLSFSLSKEVKRGGEKGKEEKRKSENGAMKLWARFVKKNKGDSMSTLSHSMTVKEKSSSKWAFFF